MRIEPRRERENCRTWLGQSIMRRAKVDSQQVATELKVDQRGHKKVIYEDHFKECEWVGVSGEAGSG